ncbi:hypothetical protein NEDG_02078 [Nematocida displodere]|uniref:Uncharacterized protein n=1 Tax=Nematocida displodere TaxID=1805483 RepID=A0A177EMF0_9MICR|nr:hypothetical protein NEDG_02078 [Nematocida displodere]
MKKTKDIHPRYIPLRMGRSDREISIINSVLGEEGLMKYNAIKARFATEEPVAKPEKNILHIYNGAGNNVENTTIFSYKSNLQRLRKKIEEHKVRITEVFVPNSPLPQTQEVVETLKTETVETIVPVNPKDVPANITAQEKPAIAPPLMPIKQINTLESFRKALAHGLVKLQGVKKKQEGNIRLEETVLTEYTKSKKGEYEITAKYDVATAKLFLTAYQPRTLASCFKEIPPKTVLLDKEIQIINMSTSKKSELILKNTNTGCFIKTPLRKLEFTLRDSHMRNHTYEVEDEEEFIRWLTLLKLRMHPVDTWDRKELFKSMQLSN